MKQNGANFNYLGNVLIVVVHGDIHMTCMRHTSRLFVMSHSTGET